MDFQELLNDYIELFSCTAKELADASGLTAVDISRYRTGKRTPDLSSPQLKKTGFRTCETCTGAWKRIHYRRRNL